VRLEDWTDEALAAELQKQRDVQKSTNEGSQRWLAARRIEHHLSSEAQRRRNVARAIEGRP
jgi:hypothetical protein